MENNGCCWQSFANTDSPPIPCLEKSELSVVRDNHSERGKGTMNNRKRFGNSPEGKKIPDARWCLVQVRARASLRSVFSFRLKKKITIPTILQSIRRIYYVRSPTNRRIRYFSMGLGILTITHGIKEINLLWWGASITFSVFDQIYIVKKSILVKVFGID